MSSYINPNAANYKTLQSSQTNPSAANYAPTSSYNGANYSPASGTSGSGYTAPTNPEPKPTTSNFSNLYNSVVGTLLKPMSTAYSGTGGETGSNPYSSILDSLKNVGSAVISSTPYSQFRQGLVGMGVISPQFGNVGALIGNMTTPHTGSWGTPDIGLTEFYNPTGMKYVTSMKDKWNQPSGVMNPVSNFQSGPYNPTTDQTLKGDILGRATDITNKNLGTTTGTTLNQMGTNLQTSFADLDKQVSDQIDAIYNDYLQGLIPAQEMQQRIADMQTQATNNIYNTMKANYESNYPLLQNQFDTDKAYIEGLIPQQKQQAEQAKGSLTNTYGAALRKIAGNEAVSEKKLGNIYSALGTADSSDFLNRQQQLQQAAGSDIAQTQSDLNGKIADIDMEQQKFEDNIKYQISNMVNELAAKKQEVMNNINLSEAQRAAALTDINTALASNLQGLAETYQNAKMQFDTMKLNAVQSSADLLKNYQVNSNLAGIVNTGYPVGQSGEEQSTTSSTINKRPLKKTINGIDYILQYINNQFQYVDKNGRILPSDATIANR
jgi:hypothetical protein